MDDKNLKIKKLRITEFGKPPVVTYIFLPFKRLLTASLMWPFSPFGYFQ